MHRQLRHVPHLTGTIDPCVPTLIHSVMICEISCISRADALVFINKKRRAVPREIAIEVRSQGRVQRPVRPSRTRQHHDDIIFS